MLFATTDLFNIEYKPRSACLNVPSDLILHSQLLVVLVIQIQYMVLYILFIKCILLFPKQRILDSSKLKEFADDNFEIGENGRKFSKQIENTAGKGEIARYEQFLLFPQCFLKTCTADT